MNKSIYLDFISVCTVPRKVLMVFIVWSLKFLQQYIYPGSA